MELRTLGDCEPREVLCGTQPAVQRLWPGKNASSSGEVTIAGAVMRRANERSNTNFDASRMRV